MNCPKCNGEMKLRETMMNEDKHYTGYICCEKCNIVKIVYKNWGESK